MGRIWKFENVHRTENPTRQFHPIDGVAIDVQLPEIPGATRVVYFESDLESSGPVSQLEAYVGAGGGTSGSWARINVPIPPPYASPFRVSGAFRHENDLDPNRVILRCRGYEPNAGAALSKTKLFAFDVTGLHYGDAWILDNKTGQSTPTTATIAAGTTETVRSLVLAGIPPGTYRVIASCEVKPNGSTGIVPVRVKVQGLEVLEWIVDGFGHAETIVGRAHLAEFVVPASVSQVRVDLELEAPADRALTFRRPGLFVVNWDEFLV